MGSFGKEKRKLLSKTLDYLLSEKDGERTVVELFHSYHPTEDKEIPPKDEETLLLWERFCEAVDLLIDNGLVYFNDDGVLF